MSNKKPYIVGISAASGVIYGIRTVENLIKSNYPVELIISEKAYFIINKELGLKLNHNSNSIKNSVLDYLNLEDRSEFLKVWLNDELWANPASGSYQTNGMIITPASMSTIASISNGIAETLLTRSADVVLKEDRKLVIVPRETPLNTIHLENMLKLSKMGAKIVPPITGFYKEIKTIDDAVDFVVGKTLDTCKIDNNIYNRWSYE